MDKIKKKWNGILYEGGYGDFSVNSGIEGKDNPDIEIQRRLEAAYLLATNPKTYEILTENSVNLFHGTNANALPNILKYGMKSGAELEEKGIEVLTGEEWSRKGGQRSFISFTDVLGTAVEYSTIQPSKKSSKDTSFGILVGISTKDIKQMRTCHVQSDKREIGIMNSVPLEYIRVIAVPESKVDFVRKLIGDNSIIVTSIGVDEMFYQTNPLSVALNPEELEKLILRKKQPEVTFNAQQVKELAEGRKKSGILDIYKKIKSKIIGKGKENENDSREE